MAADTRERILRALRDVLARGGPSCVTLDSVAAEAGLSKGGLLYHFPSKSALYVGLLESVRDSVRSDMRARSAGGDAARAFLEYAAPEDESEGFFTSLIAAVRTGESEDQQAAALLTEVFHEWEQPLRDAVADPVQAETIRLVGNGVYLSAIAGLPQPDTALLSQVFERLLAAT